MNRSTVIALTLGTTVAAPLAAVRSAATHEAQLPAADSVRRSSDWLSLLPEGEEKRRFILDCTGCHQIDDQIVRANGRPRTQGEYKEMVDKMLGFAGSTTGFPVIGHGRESVSTAAWMARNFFANPTIRPRGTLPPNARVTEFGNLNVATRVVSRSKLSTFIATDNPKEHSDQTITRAEYALWWGDGGLLAARAALAELRRAAERAPAHPSVRPGR